MFAECMHGLSLAATVTVPKLPIWEHTKTVIDIGGNKGPIAAALLKSHSHLTGFNADLPEMKATSEKFIKEQGLEDRLSFHQLDFFKDDFPETDAVIFGHILHDWNFKTKEMLLEKAYKSLNQNGACIVYEWFMDNEKRTDTGPLLMNLNMLLHTRGEEITQKTATDLLEHAGFKNIEFHSLTPFVKAIIGFKH